MSAIRQHWFKIVTAAILLILVGVLAYQALPKSAHNPNLGVKKKAESFELTDMTGKTVKLSDSNGKVRLVYFFYTNCPDVCSPTSFRLSTVQDLLKEKGVLGSKTQIFSITLDPARDTPEVINRFAAPFHPDPSGWTYLRGTEAYTQTLTEKYDMMSIKDKDGNFTHSNIIFLLDGNGNIRYYYNGSDVELTQAKIVNDMLQLLNEK